MALHFVEVCRAAACETSPQAQEPKRFFYYFVDGDDIYGETEESLATQDTETMVIVRRLIPNHPLEKLFWWFSVLAIISSLIASFWVRASWPLLVALVGTSLMGLYIWQIVTRRVTPAVEELRQVLRS